MIAYFLKSATCLALLLGFYYLVLEKEKMHNFNRFYLLGSVVFSFLAPLYIIYIDVAPVFIEATTQQTNFTPAEFSVSETVIQNTFDYTVILIGAYILVSSVLLLRFVRNLFQIIQKIQSNKKIKYQNALLVLVDDEILPHTFWKAIFINKNDYENQNIEKELFTHELTHVTQKHTLDILILESIQIVFWINPFFILLKKAVQLNHEFLADEKVIHQHQNTFQYQHLLLNKAAWKNEYYLASNLNYSLTKKRLKMMTTQSSPTKILLKKLAIVPLLTGFVFLFAQRVEAQEIIEIKEEPIETIVEEISSKKQDLSDLEIYKNYFYKNLTIQRKDKNGKKISKKYNELTKEEKARLVPPPPIELKKIIPTKKQFDELKDNSKYAVWIDGKVVKNEILNKYNHSDFARYSNSHVYKNARSKRFPQENQANLETKKYFKAQNQKRVNKFLQYLKEEHEVEEIIEEGETKIIEIKEQKKKYNKPSSNGSKQSISKIKLNSKSVFKLEENHNPILIEFNLLAKAYNKIPIEKRIIPLKELNRLEILYKQLSEKDKQNAQPFPECFLPNKKLSQEDPKFNKDWFITIEGQKYYYTFDKNERVARYYKNGKLVNLDIVKEYKKKHKIFLNLKNTGEHYVFKSEKEQNEIDSEFSDLGGMYFRMLKADKNKVPFPKNSLKPYVKLRKGDRVWYKKLEELTEEEKLLLPPPPPRPNASSAEIKRSKDAFKAWKERTGIKNVARSLKVKDTIPTKKENAKITLTNANTLEEKSFTKALEKLTKEEREKLKENVNYFIDGKPINVKDLNKIKPQNIKSTSVKREKDGSKSIYIATKKSVLLGINEKKIPETYISNSGSKVYSISKLTEQEILKHEENIRNGTAEKKNYFLDGKKITLRDVNLIETYKIKSVNITEDLEGTKSMYIVSK